MDNSVADELMPLDEAMAQLRGVLDEVEMLVGSGLLDPITLQIADGKTEADLRACAEQHMDYIPGTDLYTVPTAEVVQDYVIDLLAALNYAKRYKF